LFFWFEFRRRSSPELESGNTLIVDFCGKNNNKTLKNPSTIFYSNHFFVFSKWLNQENRQRRQSLNETCLGSRNIGQKLFRKLLEMKV
jgi:hypothetical protein